MVVLLLVVIAAALYCAAQLVPELLWLACVPTFVVKLLLPREQAAVPPCAAHVHVAHAHACPHPHPIMLPGWQARHHPLLRV